MKTITTIMCLSLTFIVNSAAAQDKPAQNNALTNSPGKSTYTPLNAAGKKLRKPSDLAACVLDKSTGLAWELKTDDDGIHDKDKDYRWGGIGAEATGTGFFDDWNNLLNATNKEKLCGFSDWRVPTIDELKTLVITNNQGLAIDVNYFANTLASPYWSSSTYAKHPEHAQTVDFTNGNSHYYNGYRGNRLPLRLVRGKLKQ
jgi:hypothetical protein